LTNALMKPSFTPCFSKKASLYSVRSACEAGVEEDERR
jgi:hypothetical protein